MSNQEMGNYWNIITFCIQQCRNLYNLDMEKVYSCKDVSCHSLYISICYTFFCLLYYSGVVQE